MADTDPQLPFRIDAHKLTWAALLGHWTDAARAAVALPDEGDGRRLKDVLPSIITLQAVWFALQHLDELSPAQRALGLDRAAVLIDEHERRVRAAWAGETIPEGVLDLIGDAREQWRAAQADRS